MVCLLTLTTQRWELSGRDGEWVPSVPIGQCIHWWLKNRGYLENCSSILKWCLGVSPTFGELLKCVSWHLISADANDIPHVLVLFVFIDYMTVPNKRCGSSTLMWWMSFGEEIYLRFQSVPSTDLYFDPFIRWTKIGHWWTDNAIQLCIHWQFYWVHVVGWLFKSLTHWPLRGGGPFTRLFFKFIFKLISWAHPTNFFYGECHRTPLMIGQHWFS